MTIPRIELESLGYESSVLTIEPYSQYYYIYNSLYIIYIILYILFNILENLL